jgi:SAM-dependent methyltransferase
MGNSAEFAKDLYKGSAAYYDKYRLPYPGELITDLIARTTPSGHGRLLDLACGTGQLAFPLAGSFAEVWALDQEPDMADMVRAKAAAAGPATAQRLRPLAASAEEADFPARSLELVVIGNAFHRLNREVVATRVRKWLQPGGHLALCWTFMPWDRDGSPDWKRAFSELLGRWKAELSRNRVPERWDQERRELPDAELLTGYGFEMIGHYEFAARHRWSRTRRAAG